MVQTATNIAIVRCAEHSRNFLSTNRDATLSEPPILKKTLSLETQKTIDLLFSNCVKSLLSGKGPQKKKVEEIQKLLEGIIKEAGSEQELTVKIEINNPCARGYAVDYIVVNSKTTGFYARFTMNSHVDRTFLFVNPGISGLGSIDARLDGLTDDNAKLLASRLAEILLDFRNPEVWKNQGTWAEKLSHHFDLDVCEGGDKAFAQRMSQIESAARNFISGLEDAGNFKVYGHSSSFYETNATVAVKHNNETIAELSVSYPDNEPFGQITLSTRKDKTEWRLENDSHVRILVTWLFNEILAASPIKQ